MGRRTENTESRKGSPLPVTRDPPSAAVKVGEDQNHGEVGDDEEGDDEEAELGQELAEEDTDGDAEEDGAGAEEDPNGDP